MSEFIGIAQGERGAVSRNGQNVMVTECRGWRVGVRVRAARNWGEELKSRSFAVDTLGGDGNALQTVGAPVKRLCEVNVGDDGRTRVTLFHPITGAALYAGPLYKGESEQG